MSVRYIGKDLLAFSGGNRLVGAKVALSSHAFHLVLLLRIGRTLSCVPVVGVLFRVFFEYFIRIVFSSDISLKATIGPGFFVAHGHDIVIGADVVVGEGCKILNGVTLGNKDTQAGFNQQPIVGDNVVIGAGAKILGGVLVGDGSVVGANSVVLTDVPPHSVFAGVPARDVTKRGGRKAECNT